MYKDPTSYDLDQEPLDEEDYRVLNKLLLRFCIALGSLSLTLIVLWFLS